MASTVVAPYFGRLQHAAKALLRAMRRPGDGERHLELIGRIREAAPDATLRSSFIVGFPGETEADVETLAAFLETARLDWGGFFPYSAEEGTPAADLPGRIDPTEVAERTRVLQRIQEGITAAQNAAAVGMEFEVVVDTVEEGRPVKLGEAPRSTASSCSTRGRPAGCAARITDSYGRI
jgi:ribosomal protein S12 methylthiotransferase